MTNKDFIVAVNKFFYYANNWGNAQISYPSIAGYTVTTVLPDFFKAFPVERVEWLKKKWNYLYEEYGSRGVMMAFYGELDGNNRISLLKWINENYELSDTFGLGKKVNEL